MPIAAITTVWVLMPPAVSGSVEGDGAVCSVVVYVLSVVMGDLVVSFIRQVWPTVVQVPSEQRWVPTQLHW